MAVPRAGAVAARSPLATVVSDYVELTKPKVQSLLLLTTIAAMEIAGDPSLTLIAATCLGGYLSAGGAGGGDPQVRPGPPAPQGPPPARAPAPGRGAPPAGPGR